MIQTRDPIETAELLAFTRAVDARSLSRAAAELGIPRATLSRRLGRLEGRLGLRLLRRTTRWLAPTDAGEGFYRHARTVLDAVDAAAASVARPTASLAGDVRVSVPPLLGEGLFAVVTSFAAAHPAVRLHVDFSSRYVDLQREGYDVVIRAGGDLEPGLVARTLATTEVVLVASPAYLADRGTPKRRADLARHRCLMGFARGELPQTRWPIEGAAARVTGAFFSNDPRLLREAALRGLGVALLPRMLVTAELDRGELVHVLPGVVRGQDRIAVVFAEREYLPPQVRAFVDAVTAWAKESGVVGGAGRPRRRST